MRSKPPSSDLVETPDSVLASFAPEGLVYSRRMLYLAGLLAPLRTLTPSLGWLPSGLSGVKRGGFPPAAPSSIVRTQSLTQSASACEDVDTKNK